MFKRVYVEITNVCNLSCVFCPGTERAKRFLSPAEFRLMAEKLRGHTRYLYFHVMGEPLLHPQLPELLAIAHELGFRVCVTTNGTLLAEKTAALLSALGGQVEEQESGLVIHGRAQLAGGTVDAWNDHRIAMAAAVAACACRGPVSVTDSQCVAKSYPRFWEDFGSLKGEGL